MLVFGVAYPLIITGIALVAGPNNGKGETVSIDGKIYGFETIGQSFGSDKYFHGRPSAVGYNAAATGGSNKGPSNPDYLAEVEQRITEFLAHNPTVKREDIPVDLVTASGGGLDPHISPEGAHAQVARIANVRGLDAAVVQNLVEKLTEKPLLGLIGPARVNVLKLNIALDELSSKK
jgi:K+-transporting ATPase ATPase C chain